MRPTSRGWGVLAVVAFGTAMSWQYGPRSLDAVVIPLAVVLVAGALTTIRTDRPESRREPVPDGFPGESRTVAVEIESDSSAAATVTDTLDDGLAAADTTVETTLADPAAEYELTLEDRGEHRIGPLSIAVRDVFGLWERRFADEETTTVVVYPRIDDLHRTGGRGLDVLADLARRANREEFTHLREYRRGDPLRDVSWKAAAKRPDDELVVREFDDDGTVGAATIAAECIPGREDELAVAVASVATYLLECEVRVGLTVGADHHPPDDGRRHHRSLLRSLARFETRELEDGDRAEADVLIQSDATGTRVVVDDREVAFDRLRGADESTEVDGRGVEDGSTDDESADGSWEVVA
ncbi:DUF58 domain-containing protein [Natronococcus occultus]|uniref:Uncharacterized protein n=1 Tax=Natronococcus occultus SP4 TaxID=694430 RepID=L0K134_9EURY|nr:DUF58 domain-containing protein [Natronococcus occultus]AGB38260.1 hypothetical protein Natoc_2487 [Natronococcus occultus SP4]